jgi:hypothetical protein
LIVIYSFHSLFFPSLSFLISFISGISGISKLDTDYDGQPGMKVIERRWFNELLERGQLIDTFRHFHPPSSSSPPDPFGPFFSWRGRPGTTNSFAGKFNEKGMRIDHVLASKKIMKAVKEVKLLGQGKGSDDPSFMTSDHCPILARFDWTKLSASDAMECRSSSSDKSNLSSSSPSSSSPNAKRRKVAGSNQEHEAKEQHDGTNNESSSSASSAASAAMQAATIISNSPTPTLPLIDCDLHILILQAGKGMSAMQAGIKQKKFLTCFDADGEGTNKPRSVSVSIFPLPDPDEQSVEALLIFQIRKALIESKLLDQATDEMEDGASSSSSDASVINVLVIDEGLYSPTPVKKKSKEVIYKLNNIDRSGEILFRHFLNILSSSDASSSSISDRGGYHHQHHHRNVIATDKWIEKSCKKKTLLDFVEKKSFDVTASIAAVLHPPSAIEKASLMASSSSSSSSKRQLTSSASASSSSLNHHHHSSPPSLSSSLSPSSSSTTLPLLSNTSLLFQQQSSSSSRFISATSSISGDKKIPCCKFCPAGTQQCLRKAAPLAGLVGSDEHARSVAANEALKKKYKGICSDFTKGLTSRVVYKFQQVAAQYSAATRLKESNSGR